MVTRKINGYDADFDVFDPDTPRYQCRAYAGHYYDDIDHGTADTPIGAVRLLLAALGLDADLCCDTVVVTRHPALVDLLIERGLVSAGTRVLDHASYYDVCGKHVIGVLPLHLAAAASQVTVVPLELTPDDRGRELSIERLREIAGDAVTYTVSRLYRV